MEFSYNKNAALFYKSAKELFLPVEIIDHFQGFVFRLGKKRYFFRGFETPFNNSCSSLISDNKYCTNKLLNYAGIPVPKSVSMHCSEFQKKGIAAITNQLKYPLVVKPTISSLGENVYCNISSPIQLRQLMEKIYIHHDFITIEEFHGNLNSYRVLVFKKKILGVVQRYPAQVIGDEIHSITELIAQSNIKRQQLGDEHAPIILDEECHIRLNELGITPEYIPKRDEKIILCYTCNASRGGTFKALNTKLCKNNAQFFIKVASVLNLEIAGIDVECTDINTPINDTNAVIIEVNSNPSVRIHENNHSIRSNPVTKKMIRSIIYRHPLSFLYQLYKHVQTSIYVKGFFFLFFISLILKWIEA